jgi:hypothetical protein
MSSWLLKLFVLLVVALATPTLAAVCSAGQLGINCDMTPTGVTTAGVVKMHYAVDATYVYVQVGTATTSALVTRSFAVLCNSVHANLISINVQLYTRCSLNAAQAGGVA